MASTVAITATKRPITKTSARDTRDAGRIPAVAYGKGLQPTPISLDYSEFLRAYRVAGPSGVIVLDIEGKKHNVFANEVTLDPVKNTIQHVDFTILNDKEKVIAHVPITVTGESVAVKNLGGILMMNRRFIDLRGLPSDIPHHIEVDITPLKTKYDMVKVADLKIDFEKLEVRRLSMSNLVVSITGAKAAAAETSATEEAEEGAETPAEGEAAATEESSAE